MSGPDAQGAVIKFYTIYKHVKKKKGSFWQLWLDAGAFSG